MSSSKSSLFARIVRLIEDHETAALSLAVRVAQLRGRLERLTAPGSRDARLAQARRPPRPARFLREAVLAPSEPPPGG